jgi:pilus assembly protein CpaF
MHGDTVTLQDAFLFDHSAGTDRDGRILGRAVPTGVRPHFYERFAQYGVAVPAGVAVPTGEAAPPRAAGGGVPHLVPVAGHG